ncbi:hypothetical protein ABZP36_019551 [Zizania latifolia]
MRRTNSHRAYVSSANAGELCGTQVPISLPHRAAWPMVHTTNSGQRLEHDLVLLRRRHRPVGPFNRLLALDDDLLLVLLPLPTMAAAAEGTAVVRGMARSGTMGAEGAGVRRGVAGPEAVGGECGAGLRR